MGEKAQFSKYAQSVFEETSQISAENAQRDPFVLGKRVSLTDNILKNNPRMAQVGAQLKAKKVFLIYKRTLLQKNYSAGKYPKGYP